MSRVGVLAGVDELGVKEKTVVIKRISTHHFSADYRQK
jgi:hypothetical protein